MTPNYLTMLVISFSISTAYSQQMEPKVHNLNSFAQTEIEITEELKRLTPATYQSHPEFGVLPFNAPCDNCYELIHKRTLSTRMFVEKGSEGTQFYSQAAKGALHYTDENGNLRTLDYRLQPEVEGSQKYSAPHQDFPATLDASLGETSFTTPHGEIIHFNRDLELLHKSSSGTTQNFGSADWTNYTVGNEGVRIIDAWPNIDIEIKFALGQVKTDYIIKSNLGLTNGHLVFIDKMQADGFQMQMHETVSIDPESDSHIGTVRLLNEAEEGIYIETAFGYDQSNTKENATKFGYKIDNQNLELWVPVDWMNESDMIYPLIIDPSVTSSATYTAGIIRFRYDGSFCGGANADCNYTLSVPRPANSTLTGASFSIVSQTLAGSCFFVCWMSEAGYYFQTSCGTDGYWGCNVDASGTCTGTNLAFDPLVTCLTPVCSGNVDFTIYTSYCYCSTGGTCGTSCQRINNNTWVITITGSTLETLGNTTTGDGSVTYNDPDCVGTLTLDPSASNGVPGYTYSWSTGATSPSISVGVTPAVYTCTVTDACGVSRLATFNVGCPLSAETNQLSATAKDQHVELNWQTLSEEGIVKFEIQRSDDGIIYETLFIQDAQGGQSGSLYSSLDQSPLTGLSYYRLITHYITGDQLIGEGVSVLYHADEGLVITPNPTSGEFHINFNAVVNQPYFIEVINDMGKVVYQTEILATSHVSILKVDNNLPSGTYTIRISGVSQAKTARLVIR